MSEYIVEVHGQMPDAIYERALVEIVRCRDCWHYDPNSTEGGVCFLPDGDGDFARWEVESDGYCKWGERYASHAD